MSINDGSGFAHLLLHHLQRLLKDNFGLIQILIKLVMITHHTPIAKPASVERSWKQKQSDCCEQSHRKMQLLYKLFLNPLQFTVKP